MKNFIFILPLVFASAAFAQGKSECPPGYVITSQGCQPATNVSSQPNSFLQISVQRLVTDASALRIASDSRIDGRRGGVTVQVGALNQIAQNIEISAIDLSRVLTSPVVAQSRVRQMIEAIDRAALDAFKQATVGAITARGDVFTALYSLSKSIGAVQMALDMPAPVVVMDPAPLTYGNVKAVKCVLSFNDAWNDKQIVSGEGFDMGMANADLYRVCSSVKGSFGSVTNAQKCQMSLASAKCVDITRYKQNTKGDMYGSSGYSSFAACTLGFKDAWSDDKVLSGSGPNSVIALDAIWNSCKNIPGSFGSIQNSATCKLAFVNERASCVLR
jgi:hypothetical protein